MAAGTDYKIHTDIQFGPLELIDVERLAGDCTEEWFNQSLCEVNDCVVRMGVLKGEFHWHVHHDEDEFFYVVEGCLFVDLEDKTVELTPGKGILVPRGVRHNTRAPERTVVLMFEGRGFNAPRRS